MKGSNIFYTLPPKLDCKDSQKQSVTKTYYARSIRYFYKRLSISQKNVQALHVD